MQLKDIKNNVANVADVFTKTKQVDTNSILMLSIAELLILLLEKDGTDDTRNKLKI